MRMCHLPSKMKGIQKIASNILAQPQGRIEKLITLYQLIFQVVLSAQLSF